MKAGAAEGGRILKIAEVFRGRKLSVVAALAVITLAAAYPRSELVFVENSPDARHRLEYYHPHLLLGVWFRYRKGMQMPRFVRLYRNSDNAYFGESPVIDVSVGVGTNWLIKQSGEVSVDMQYRFTQVE